MENQVHTSRLEDSKQWINSRVQQMKPAVRNAGMRLQQQLRSKPAMWAGIAAGVGFAAGFAGRIARHRMRHRDDADAFVILEAC
ncbi:MAG TPA: hypothetical protein VI391_04015 [Thermoanaerobaculia bacterium]